MGARNLAQPTVSCRGWYKECGVGKVDTALQAKQCYHCQGLGHVQADCPTLRISGAGLGGRCYSCGQPGHLAVRRLHGESSLRKQLNSLEAFLSEYRISSQSSSWCWPRDHNKSRSFWARLPGRLHWGTTASNLLQMWWSKPLRSGLSGAGHEVLRLWQACQLSLLERRSSY